MESLLTRNRMSRCMYKCSNLEGKDQMSSSIFIPTRRCLRDTASNTTYLMFSNFYIFASWMIKNMAYHWGLHLHFPDHWLYEMFLCVFICPLYTFMKDVDSHLLLILIRVWFSFGLSIISYSCNQFSLEHMDYRMFIADV